MGLHRAYLGRLTIASGAAGAYSNVLRARELAFARAIVFYNPAAFTGTIAVYAGPREDTTADLTALLYSAGVQIVLTAGRMERHDINGFESLQIKTSGTESAPRDVDVFAILDIGA